MSQSGPSQKHKSTEGAKRKRFRKNELKLENAVGGTWDEGAYRPKSDGEYKLKEKKKPRGVKSIDAKKANGYTYGKNGRALLTNEFGGWGKKEGVVTSET